MNPFVEYVSRNKVMNKFKLPSSIVLLHNKNSKIHVGVFKKKNKVILFNIFNVCTKEESPELVFSKEFETIECLMSSESVLSKINYTVFSYCFPPWPIISVYNDDPMLSYQNKQADKYFKTALCSKSHNDKRKMAVWNSFIFYNLETVSKLKLKKFTSYLTIKNSSPKLWEKWNNWNKILHISKNSDPANEILFSRIFDSK